MGFLTFRAGSNPVRGSQTKTHVWRGFLTLGSSRAARVFRSGITTRHRTGLLRGLALDEWIDLKIDRPIMPILNLYRRAHGQRLKFVLHLQTALKCNGSQPSQLHPSITVDAALILL
jgi:hypothetical protein